MNSGILHICTLILLTGCTHAAPAPAVLAIQSSQLPADPAGSSDALLDGVSVNGRVRAQGLIGLVSVPGTLSFRDGQLIWVVEGDSDTSAYTSWHHDGMVEFRAEQEIDTGERVVWSGRYNGVQVQDVTAVWYRNEGDFVHDLLLPDRVTLNFTPDD